MNHSEVEVKREVLQVTTGCRSSVLALRVKARRLLLNKQGLHITVNTAAPFCGILQSKVTVFGKASAVCHIFGSEG